MESVEPTAEPTVAANPDVIAADVPVVGAPVEVVPPVDAPVETVENVDPPQVVTDIESAGIAGAGMPPVQPEPQPVDATGALIPTPDVIVPPVVEMPTEVVQAPVDVSSHPVVDGLGPANDAGVGAMPVPEVIEPEASPLDQSTEPPAPTPEPSTLTDASPQVQMPYDATDGAGKAPSDSANEAADAAAAVQEATAAQVTGLVPPPSSVGEDDDKALPDPEAVQAIRDLMPADVEQVIKAIATEAAMEAIKATVVEEAIAVATLEEPGTPTS